MIKNKSSIAKQGALYVVLTVLLLLAFVPIFLMISVSLKSTYQLNTDFWASEPGLLGKFTRSRFRASTSTC